MLITQATDQKTALAGEWDPAGLSVEKKNYQIATFVIVRTTYSAMSPPAHLQTGHPIL
jgi:hypothetical protein